MQNNINISTPKRNHSEIRLTISDQEVNIRVFFSISFFQILVDFMKLGETYRSAFAKVVFLMHQLSNQKNAGDLVEQDFITTSDENLTLVLTSILEQNSELQAEFKKLTSDNVFENFYKANIAVLNHSIQEISESLGKTAKVIVEQNRQIDMGIAEKLQMLTLPQDYLSNQTTQALDALRKTHEMTAKAFINISKNSLQDVVSTFEQIYPAFTSVLSTISQPVLDLQKISLTLQNYLVDFACIESKNLQNFRDASQKLLDALQDIFRSIETGILLTRGEWNQKRETLLRFGWFYSDALPDELINTIYEGRDDISKDYVDELIVNYFRQDNYCELQRIVDKWVGVPLFDCRKKVFQEAFDNHSRGSFLSSFSLLSLHIEGIIVEFVIKCQSSTGHQKLRVVINTFKEECGINNDDIDQDIINILVDEFCRDFVHSEFEKSPNFSRHKLAHGHVYDSVSEADSLKHFLIIDQLHSFISG